ncbi:PspA/IM30 family protein [Pseudanabaenaceae cyanobacterium LEGE 13415]|nr:PspA/IM30 family protein [Pseudanabaenaceae cyanobacterium LEGE 13415]
MKKFTYWLMGKQAGRVIESTWCWLWNLPLEQQTQLRGQALEITLAEIQQTIGQLAEAIAKQETAFNTACKRYSEKVQEQKTLKQQAILAERSGNEDAVRLAVTQLIQLEKLLPQLEQQIAEAQQYVATSKQHLKAEQFKIEQLKQEIQTAKDLDAITDALNTIFTIDPACSPSSADHTIKKMIDMSKSQYEIAKTRTELSQQSSSQAQLTDLLQDEQFNQRLQQIREEAAQSLS